MVTQRLHLADAGRCLKDGVEHSRGRRLRDNGASETIPADSREVTVHLIDKRRVSDHRHEFHVWPAQVNHVIDHRAPGDRHQRLGRGRL